MKINVWGINYSPEQTGIAPYNTALCAFLAQRGHNLRMVTTFSYYPAWRKLPSDRWQLFRTDVIDGVKVHRGWHYVPRRVNTLKRILHEGSFVFTSLLRQLFLPCPDVIVVISPPLLLGAAAWVLGKLKKTPFLFHVQDLQPDAAAGLGMLKSGALLRALYWLEQFAYQKALRVSGIVPTMLEAFQGKGVDAAKTFHFPNPVTLPDLSRLPTPGTFRQRHHFSKKDFLVVYSGNLGVKQGLEVLIDAARLLAANPQIRLVICGEGSRREHLAQLLADQQLANVLMLPLQPEEQYREMLVDADLCLITQQKDASRCFFPSKLLTTLAFAKPVLTIADEDSPLARAVQKSQCGVNLQPEQPQKVAETLSQLALHPDQLRLFGQAGRKYVEQFELESVLIRFDLLLRQLVPQKQEGGASFSRPSLAEKPLARPFGR